MKILITGSTGFVGRHLVPKLLSANHEILELTIQPDLSFELYGTSTQKYILDDNQERLCSVVTEFKPEIVIHLATYLTANDDYDTLLKLLNSNITFFCKVLDALKETQLKLFINTGTFAEYFKGDNTLEPAYLYAATKTASRSFLDYYSKVGGYKQATVVPYTIYGGIDTQKKIIDLVYDSINSPTPIDLSPGEQVLDFIHIDDVTNFYVTLIENIEKLPPKANFQLGTGTGHTLKQLAAIIEEFSQNSTKINWGGKPYRTSDVMYAVANKNTILDIVEWSPKINLIEGVQQYLKHK